MNKVFQYLKYLKDKTRSSYKLFLLYYEIKFIRYLWKRNYNNAIFYYSDRSNDYKAIVIGINLDLLFLLQTIKSKKYNFTKRQDFATTTKRIEEELMTNKIPYINQNEYLTKAIRAYLSNLNFRFVIYSF